NTTYTYGACGNSFPTSVSLPLSLSKTLTWDANCAGGVLASETDLNSPPNTTHYYYNDANYWRMTSTTDPMPATTNISYSTSSSPFAVESTLNFNGTTSTADSRTTLDGLERVHISQRKQSQTSSNYDSVQTDYDSVGRPYRVSVPYPATAGTAYTGSTFTTTTYDALGRATQITDGGGGWTKYTYTGNDVLVEVGPAP